LQVRIAESQAERENKLFIGMLPKTLNEDDLHTMFIQYGDLREVHVIRGPDGGSKGCAFVKFVDREAAMVAIEDMNDIIPMVRYRIFTSVAITNSHFYRDQADLLL
jgi:RNA recognition motif-containing protein